ncbi:non-specific lipid transfer protein GPI-anchored 2-like [Juglans microcarpa x Juglans regia]|uniref:non-specific lipid transfer protein GPI-anchored 2-like n=1 Tax=Juglans microcarpa x Juglans regia TaxID=2249226 RepID=UPI001B7ED8AC|nr:non-specific lipid transfer protein GPI-anchored 2-like [Juglans microcarpa x Juglans regia]
MVTAKPGVAAMVAAALFFSAFYNVSAQGPVPGPAQAEAPSGLGEGPAPSATAGCFDVLLNMSDCLTYVEDGSKTTKPDKGCCPELAGLVDSNPICLCQLLATNTTASFGIKINLKRALNLPSVCGVPTPPVSTCSVAGIDVPPIGAPTSTEDSATPGAQPPGAPSTGNNGNGASSILGSAIPFTVGLVIAFLPTLF